VIRVAGLEYQVRLSAHPGDFSSHDLTGEVDYESCNITVDARLSPRKQQQTFIHEIVHVIVEGEEVSKRKDVNERYVTRVSNILYSILADNDMLKDGWWDSIVDERPVGNNISASSTTRGRPRRTDHAR
jgi:hypothetical protein